MTRTRRYPTSGSWKTELGAFEWREAQRGEWPLQPAWLTAGLDRSISSFAVSADSRAIHIGELDYRVPLNNSLEYWTVLQRQQVPSRLVVFPDENPWILKGGGTAGCSIGRSTPGWPAGWRPSRRSAGTGRDGGGFVMRRNIA